MHTIKWFLNNSYIALKNLFKVSWDKFFFKFIIRLPQADEPEPSQDMASTATWTLLPVYLINSQLKMATTTQTA